MRHNHSINLYGIYVDVSEWWLFEWNRATSSATTEREKKNDERNMEMKEICIINSEMSLTEKYIALIYKNMVV